MRLFGEIMKEIVIPIFIVLNLIAVLSIVVYMSNSVENVQNEQYDEFSNDTTELIENEVKDLPRDLILTPLIPYILGGVIFIAGLFGIALKFV